MSILEDQPDPELPAITRTTPDMKLVNRWYRETFGTRPTRDHSQEQSAWAIRDENNKNDRRKK